MLLKSHFVFPFIFFSKKLSQSNFKTIRELVDNDKDFFIAGTWLD